VRVYQNEPMYPDTIVAPVYHLDSSVFELEGSYLTTHNEVFGDPVVISRDFDFFGLPFPNSENRALAEAYHTADRFIEYLRRLGINYYSDGSPTYVDALDVEYVTSVYDSSTHEVALSAGGLFPDADDQMITGHEFGHRFHHIVGGTGQNGYPFDFTHTLPENRGIDEGSADYHTASFFNATCWAPIYAIQIGEDCFHRLDRDDNLIDNDINAGNEHEVGQFWSSAFWRLRQVLGKGVADRLAFEFVLHILPTDGFNEGVEAVVQGNDSLYAGNHEDAIRRMFAFAKVYGANGSYTFTTDWIQSPERPYPNTESSEQTLTLTGAGAVGGICCVACPMARSWRSGCTFRGTGTRLEDCSMTQAMAGVPQSGG